MLASIIYNHGKFCDDFKSTLKLGAYYKIGEDSIRSNISDFQWFITTICEAVDKKLVVTLRYDSPKGLITYDGLITEAKLDYESEKFVSTLNIKFLNGDTNSVQNLTYTFDTRFVEENKNSSPGNFMKYYINDSATNRVIVGFIFSYK